MLYPATVGIQSHPQLQTNDGLVELSVRFLTVSPGK